MIANINSISIENLHVILKSNLFKECHKDIFRYIYNNSIDYNKNNNGIFIELTNLTELDLVSIKNILLIHYNVMIKKEESISKKTDIEQEKHIIVNTNKNNLNLSSHLYFYNINPLLLNYYKKLSI